VQEKIQTHGMSKMGRKQSNKHIIEYCLYCKEPIYDDNYIVERKIYRHIDCWKQERGYYDELEFNEGSTS